MRQCVCSSTTDGIQTPHAVARQKNPKGAIVRRSACGQFDNQSQLHAFHRLNIDIQLALNKAWLIETAIICVAVLSCEVLAFLPMPNAISLHLARAKDGVRKRESQHNRKSTATYQDEAYEMFLSNIEKDMIESWNEQMERSLAEEVPSFGLDTAFGGEVQENYDDDDDKEEITVATIELESDGTNSKDFLMTQSTSKLQERLREAGLPIEGSNKLELVRRLLGVEGEPSATTTKAFLSTLTAEQLRERLREAGLPITGQKETLVDRLLGTCE